MLQVTTLKPSQEIPETTKESIPEDEHEEENDAVEHPFPANTGGIENTKSEQNEVDQKRSAAEILLLSSSLSSSSSAPVSPPTSLDSVKENTAAAINAKRRKDLFGDCALVEIIHLHDCLRGALVALEKDLSELSQMVLNDCEDNKESSGIEQDKNDKVSPLDPQLQLYLLLNELESRATARFQVIWSVFRAHSAAEDEFIWPALRRKTQGQIQGCCDAGGRGSSSPYHQLDESKGRRVSNDESNSVNAESKTAKSIQCCGGTSVHCLGGDVSPDQQTSSCPDEVIEQEEYEEDHADEERMFTMMDHLLTRLRKGLLQQRIRYQMLQQQEKSETVKESSSNYASYNNRDNIINTMKEIQSLVKTLNQHLMVHLDKEEKQCMPLVVKHLSKSEIHELVGKIMGKRSSDMIAQILTMAVQNLNEADKEEMVKHMKQAMVGTFFDRWLAASGWMDGTHTTPGKTKTGRKRDGSRVASDLNKPTITCPGIPGLTLQSPAVAAAALSPSSDVSESKRLKVSDDDASDKITTQAELEKLIRAVATNPSLTPAQKNTTIQGLRTSVWKRNQRLVIGDGLGSPSGNLLSTVSQNAKKGLHPAVYYQNNLDGEPILVWKAKKDTNNFDQAAKGDQDRPNDGFVPKFTEAELSPTYHDDVETGRVLGCPHYARACKLRHPLSGRLYTCRLCCEQEREGPSVDKDQPLDRYSVTEVACMKCKTLQPAKEKCVNPECELHEKGFAKYYCDICHLYDDRPRPIFHCPYCNTCRMGQGLGIDYRHCMRCNACVSLSDNDHRCIPQKLQGSCPICHDTLFNSTEPLRGLRCGHVMHMTCFTEYRRGHNYTCPLCMRCVEDMSDYFSLLDQAVRMQSMPPLYQNTVCNIYCQDCEKTGQCPYHFVGQKCPHCGSYNTREMGRFETSSDN